MKNQVGMRPSTASLKAAGLSIALLCAFGSTFSIADLDPAAPSITTTAARNGAVVVTLGSAIHHAIIYYTVD